MDLPRQVNQLRVNLDLCVAAPIAKEPIDLFQGCRDVLAVAAISDGGGFLRVDIVE